ncbi:TIGR04086 family membrane protein, partial [Bacillus sp. SIMBA_069]
MSVAVIYGVGSIFAIAMIASLIVSILLRFTSLTESSLTYVIMIVSFLSLFIGGFISG